LILSALLAACSTPGAQPPSVPAPQAPVGQEAPAPAVPAQGIAADTLRAEAREASKQGHFERALALLERAHRLEPGEPGIYLELAKVYRRLGDEDMAQATAQRGLLYCDEARLCDRLRDYTSDS
jgi:tetratricopeptide (TPR) repeat protein